MYGSFVLYTIRISSQHSNLYIYMAVYLLFPARVLKKAGPGHSLSRKAVLWPGVCQIDDQRK